MVLELEKNDLVSNALRVTWNTIPHRNFKIVHTRQQHVAALLQVEHLQPHLVLLIHRELAVLRLRRVHVMNRIGQQQEEGVAVTVRVEVELVQQVIALHVPVVVDKQVLGRIPAR